MAKEITKEELQKLRRRALCNASKQRMRISRGETVNVSPVYWESVAREYSNKISELEIGRKVVGKTASVMRIYVTP